MAPIAAEFGHFADVSWVVTGYLLTSAAATPLAGRSSDCHGRRAVIIGALLVMLAASVACASAPGLTVLVVGRPLQRIGGGALMTLPNTLIADILPVRVVSGHLARARLAASPSWRWIVLRHLELPASRLPYRCAYQSSMRKSHDAESRHDHRNGAARRQRAGAHRPLRAQSAAAAKIDR
ncbi:MFS transporter [Paraburkholderia sp. CNPSo 3281]|uniref:MFS transporter n=1 Tax=Paraburkholderia sp. CNPSo 3281 TaxID=2940933 RepID=UPI0035CCD910